jgi:hypothetical protein
MALVESALATDLKAIFKQMHSGDTSKDDDWYAEQFAKAVTDHIKRAAVPTGAVIIGVTGQAVGTPNPTPINVT